MNRSPRGIGRAGRALLAIGILLAASACSDPLTVVPCGEIPGGGCPTGRGGSCSDVVCRALYECGADGTWTLRTTCPPAPDAGAAVEGGADAAPLCEAASPSSGGLTCAPELELPDCPLDVVGGCPATACTTGCEQFFACNVDGWGPYPAASCDADGGLRWADGGP